MLWMRFDCAFELSWVNESEGKKKGAQNVIVSTYTIHCVMIINIDSFNTINCCTIRIQYSNTRYNIFVYGTSVLWYFTYQCSHPSTTNIIRFESWSNPITVLGARYALPTVFGLLLLLMVLLLSLTKLFPL